MANLDPDTKCNDSQRHRGSRQLSHYREEPASEAESMKKTEEKSHAQTGSTAAAKRPANILERYDHDAQGDHRLDDFRGHSHEVEDGKGERDGMSEGEGGDYFKELPETRDRERERADEEQMIVAGKNMHETTPQIISGQPPGARR